MANFITIFAFAFIFVISSSFADDKPPEVEECLKKSGATEADLKARPRKNSEEIHCFWKCIMEKKGVLSSDGTFNEAVYEKGFPKAAGNLNEQQISALKQCFGTMTKITTCGGMNQVRACFESLPKA